MRVCAFDLETYSLNANTGILLCAVIKGIGDKHSMKVIRADEFPAWEKDRSNVQPIVEAVIHYLLGVEGDENSGFDIFVAHNGQRFDKRMLTTWALKYKLPIGLRFSKFIDPVLLLRQHCRLNRNTLDEAIQFFNVPHKKTPVAWEHWMRATLNGDKKSLDYIVEHCKSDVLALEFLYDKYLRRIVKDINERGSDR